MGALDVEKNLFSFTHRDDPGRQCRSISFTSAVTVRPFVSSRVDERRGGDNCARVKENKEEGEWGEWRKRNRDEFIFKTPVRQIRRLVASICYKFKLCPVVTRPPPSPPPRRDNRPRELLARAAVSANNRIYKVSRVACFMLPLLFPTRFPILYRSSSSNSSTQRLTLCTSLFYCLLIYLIGGDRYVLFTERKRVSSHRIFRIRHVY